MYKKYVMKCKAETPNASSWSVEFFVYSKPTRNGFCHLAAVIGPLPTEAGKCLTDFMSADDAHRLRRSKASYLNRTWESWPGQECLKDLWHKLSECKALRMERISRKNPFDSDKEPKHEDIWDPAELFARG